MIGLNVCENQTVGQELSENDYIQFVIHGIIQPVIIIPGLVGNFLAIFVLFGKKMQSSAWYLIWLAAYDIFLLISNALSFTIPLLNIKYKNMIFPKMQPYTYPISLSAQTGSVYTTIAFAYERWKVIKSPLNCTNKPKTKLILTMVFIFAITYNLPRWFEYQTRLNKTCPVYVVTWMGSKNLYKKLYLITVYVLCMFATPFAILIVFNHHLIKAVRESQQNRREMLVDHRHGGIGPTTMLITIVIMFLVCQTPAFADNCVWDFLSLEQRKSKTYIIFTGISNTMVIINSAANFFLYCLFGQRFRQKAKIRLFCMVNTNVNGSMRSQRSNRTSPEHIRLCRANNLSNCNAAINGI